jgi:hypothetical protein
MLLKKLIKLFKEILNTQVKLAGTFDARKGVNPGLIGSHHGMESP